MAVTTHRVGAGTTVSGAVDGRGDLVVAGAIAGSVRIDGALRIDAGGMVRAADAAAIEAAALDAAGQIHGTAQVSGVARLRAGAALRGALVAPRVVVEIGAHVSGWLETTSGWETLLPARAAPVAETEAPATQPDPASAAADLTAPDEAPSDAAPAEYLSEPAADVTPRLDDAEAHQHAAADAAASPDRGQPAQVATVVQRPAPQPASGSRPAPRGKRR